jgi:hypothetical protein
MKIKVDDLPNWNFDIKEISVNVYRVQAEHKSGARVDLTGTDPDNLIQRAKESANAIQKELDALRNLNINE